MVLAALLLIWILVTMAHDTSPHRPAVIVFDPPPPPGDDPVTVVALQWE